MLTFNILVLYFSSQFAMSHGSYDSNLGSEIMILVGDIRSRSWPNIGGTYGTYKTLQSVSTKTSLRKNAFPDQT